MCVKRGGEILVGRDAEARRILVDYKGRTSVRIKKKEGSVSSHRRHYEGGTEQGEGGAGKGRNLHNSRPFSA